MSEVNFRINVQPGDLIFFYRNNSSTKNAKSLIEDKKFEKAIISASLHDFNIYHVAMITFFNEILNENNCNKFYIKTSQLLFKKVEGLFVIHATKDGVRHESLNETFKYLNADMFEIADVTINLKWKLKAVKWTKQQIGCYYNDIFSANCLDSRGRRAFYCCQLISEAYKITNEVGQSPFLLHKLNFENKKRQLIPYWVEYFKKKCPNNPQVPQGCPGTHPSILHASPTVKVLTTFYLNFSGSQTSLNFLIDSQINSEEIPAMNTFNIPKDFLKALHFINGTRLSLAKQQSKKFKIYEPRNGQYFALN